MNHSHWSIDTEDNSRGLVHIIDFFDGVSHHTFTADQVKRDSMIKNPRAITRRLRKKAIELMLNIDQAQIDAWAVNLQYDLINIFADHLEVLEIGYVGSRVISARVPGTRVSFFDTLNHWKIGVAGMGKRIGLEKLETDDFNNVTYCRRDSEICWFFVNKMRETYESIGCKLKATIGSTALRYFEEEFFQKTRKQIFKNSELEFMKRGYYGGRTEVFRTNPIGGTIFYFDFNSLYPSVMRGDFPILTEGGHAFTKQANFENEGFVDAELEVPAGSLPFLPYRDEETKRLIFPVGKFRGVYTYPEIRYALALGVKIKKVKRCFEFQAGVSRPFEAFVNFVYAKRLEAQARGDDLMADAFKLLANNLYGKFGQGREFTKLVPHHGNLKPGDIVLGPLVMRENRGPYPTHTNFVWSAYTTAYGRIKLHRAALEVEQKGGELLYVDTDSLIFENETPIFETSKQLGELKLEGVFKYAHFKLPKLYHLESMSGDEIFKAKGIPKAQAEEFFKTGVAKFKKPYKLREALRRNMSPTKKFRIVPNFWDDIEKKSHKIYDKRLVNSDGSTKPLIIGG